MSSYPSTYSAWRRSPGTIAPPGKRLTISLSTNEQLPSALGPDDVIIKIHAISLNYRDFGTLIGNYPLPFEDGGIPCSDAAGEVVAVGGSVSEFAVGDRVMPIASIGERGDEDEDDDGMNDNIGIESAGVLAEYVVFKAKHLVRVPEGLGWEEASTLACAGITAYNALSQLSHVPRNASALLQGTGGVSMFALLLCISAGIRPIITSSSDAKIAELSKLHPSILGINYKKVGGSAGVAAEAKRLTNGRGVDFVVNNTGIASLIDDINALCDRGGAVSLVGFLEGFGADWDRAGLMGLMAKRAKLQGIGMGSKKDFQAMNAYIQEKKVDLKPLLTEPVFKFQDAEKAYAKLESGDFTGKIVIKVD